MAKVIGRQHEIHLLDTIERENRSVFVAVYGRRRVGKTFLVRSVYDGRFAFQTTGIAQVNTDQQLVNFHTSLVRAFPQVEDKPLSADWFSAFQLLINGLESLEGTQKKIVFFDELPWFDTPNSMFVQALEHFWNSWASARTDILLVVCGSAASWMINELINNTGGLYNRVTHQIELAPFTLAECEAFFTAKSPGFDRYQLLQLYMVFGGIPFYLEAIDPQKSATQNIDALCFKPRGAFRHEFDRLFASLFKKSEKHVAVVEALAKKAKGMERSELLNAAGLPNGGNTSIVLRELEESHFIRKANIFGKQKNNALYQLSDFFSLFYLRFIKDNSGFDEGFWIKGTDSPAIRAWSGYAFEQVCISHLHQINSALGISGTQTQAAAWSGSDGESNAQIDLLIDRRDQVVNLCEMKFSIDTFTISKPYAAALRNKISVFKNATKTNKAVWLTFVSTFGVSPNEHAQSLVHQPLDMNALFS